METADSMSIPVVALRDLCLRRGSRTVLDGVSVDVARGEIVALMGASGSGKTTLLRAIAGLEPFERGTVDVDGVLVAAGAPRPATLRSLRTRVGMVFQFHCLFEHLTAIENVWLAPVHVQRAPADDARSRGLELLRQLGVEHRANALPRELSGGEAQRVALARALVREPQLLLLDEPFAALDALTRYRMHELVLSLWRAHRPAVLLVTHDVEEAIALADRVLVLDAGRIVAEERIKAPRGQRASFSGRLREQLLSYLGGDLHGDGVPYAEAAE